MRGAIRFNQASSGVIRRNQAHLLEQPNRLLPPATLFERSEGSVVRARVGRDTDLHAIRHLATLRGMCRGTQRQSGLIMGTQQQSGLIRSTQRQSGLIRGTQSTIRCQSATISRNHRALARPKSIEQSVAISRHESQSAAISCSPSQSAAISRNQSQSAAITWRICSRRASASFHRPPLAHTATAALKLITFGLTP